MPEIIQEGRLSRVTVSRREDGTRLCMTPAHEMIQRAVENTETGLDNGAHFRQMGLDVGRAFDFGSRRVFSDTFFKFDVRHGGKKALMTKQDCGHPVRKRKLRKVLGRLYPGM
ncbi:hypothetical protein OQA88_2161 [Cercophora sp. LCS_1]